ncbi:MAG: sigma-54-dependent Fis family transcriptional regulator [Acidobacteria bacterium]|nr:sigma-54-dependent Fis family transcriptional regulator [Acidobacteriota bacterium]MBI3655995.1 sigma-54-dependent Fis family transcriptional regulator [Acidobacteriota bacterium]
MNSAASNKAHILVVDDEEALASVISDILALEGYEVTTAFSGEEALERVRQYPYDLLLVDLKLPIMQGDSLLRESLALYPDLIVMMMTGSSDVQTAVNLIKMGAYDYLGKPFENDELIIKVQRALAERHLKQENQFLKSELVDKYNFDNIIGASAAMQNVFRLIKLTSAKNSTVLLTGETGTGKELVARAIHYNSLRREFPLICVNCAAIPENLLEDELFGHIKGAFTGAYQPRIGRFEQADKGTLFLDEIGCMSLELQAKLLRVLQERSFERIGGTQNVRVDVRIIAATNSNLAARVRDGLFREDLFYRLNVIPITIQPLRERRDDIPVLVQHFAKKICDAQGIPLKCISQEAMKQMMAFDWPGNVRQLENAVEMAIVMSGERQSLTAGDFPALVTHTEKAMYARSIVIPEGGIQLNSIVSDLERELILQSLEKAKGNKKRAADLLHIKRTTLVEKLKRMNLMDTTSMQ